MSEEIDAHVLRKYERGERVGKGAYGIVWKCCDKKTKVNQPEVNQPEVNQPEVNQPAVFHVYIRVKTKLNQPAVFHVYIRVASVSPYGILADCIFPLQ
jgi:hypothetical protein